MKNYSFLPANFDNTHDRIWVGKDFWSVPLEDWKVEDGRLHCTGTVPQSRVNLLTYLLLPGAGDFNVSLKISLSAEGSLPGSAGEGNFPRDMIVSTGIDVHDSEIADLDGDGDPDILGKPYDGDAPRIDIWLQNGTGKNEKGKNK